MTSMPQMVALYNGVGGGAVALIAWSEFRLGMLEIDEGIVPEIPLEILVPVLFSMVVGSVSFWGSNIAFAKLQDLIPTQPLKVPGQQVINALLLVGIVGACIYIGVNNDDPNEAVFIAVLLAAALLGNLVVLPIGGADMPVVISLLNAFTGLSAAAAGFSLDNVALIVAGTLVGSSGTLLTMEMATAMNRSVSNVLFAGFGGAPAGGRRRRRRGAPAQVDRRPGRRDRARLRRLRRDRPRLRPRRRPGPARRQGDGRRAREARRQRQLRDPPGRRAGCPAT